MCNPSENLFEYLRTDEIQQRAEGRDSLRDEENQSHHPGPDGNTLPAERLIGKKWIKGDLKRKWWLTIGESERLIGKWIKEDWKRKWWLAIGERLTQSFDKITHVKCKAS